MKKIYQTPALTVVKLQVVSHLMDISSGGSASINRERVTDGDGFTKGQGTWGDVWGSDDDDK